MSVDFTNPYIQNQAKAGDDIMPTETSLDELTRDPLDEEYLDTLYSPDGEVVEACERAMAEAIKDNTDLSRFPTAYIDGNQDIQLLASANDNLNNDEEQLDEKSAELESKGIGDQSGMIAAARYNDMKVDEEVRRRLNQLA